MTGKTHNQRLGFLAIAVMGALSVTACSTTQSAHMGTRGAPITYKADQTQVKSASLTKPYASYSAVPQNRAPARPQAEAPQTYSQPPKPAAQPQVRQEAALPRAAAPKRTAPGFNPRSVDTELYAHQRIGKTYTIMGQSYTPQHNPYYDETGIASWYGDKFHGKLTANGEYYDMDGLTAAHKTLPLNSMVYVTNLETGEGMAVRINDRGPFVDGRIIDLSREVARRLGLFSSGLGEVRVQYAGPADPMAHKLPEGIIPRPPTPSLKDQSSDLVAQLPQVSAPYAAQPQTRPDYQPMREFNQPPAQSAALPQAQPKPPVQAQPQVQAPVQAPVQRQFPFQPETTAPNVNNPLVNPHIELPSQAPKAAQTPLADEPAGDAPVTLTIKGPVHMASSRETDTKARFIPAVNYKTVPAKD